MERGRSEKIVRDTCWLRLVHQQDCTTFRVEFPPATEHDILCRDFSASAVRLMVKENESLSE